MDLPDFSETSVLRAKRVRLDEVSRDDRVCTITELPGSPCSSKGRLAKLSAPVKGCSHAELVHLSETIEPLLKRDFLLSLPLEISVYILSFLSLRDILRCAQVSSRWQRVASDSLLWYRLCLRDDIIDSAAQSIQESDSQLRTAELNWKAVYRRCLETRCNWLHGSRWPPVVLGAHHNHVITCLEVFNDWAITGSDDSSICIWNLTHGQLIINLFGHIGGVWSLTVLPPSPGPGNPPALLVSGSCDRTARVWSLDGSRWPCLTTLFGHQSTVRCLAGQAGEYWTNEADRTRGAVSASAQSHETAVPTCPPVVVTGSRDTTLRLWDALSGRCLRVFQGHRGAVRCVQFCGTTIVSGSYDCTVRVWCAQTGECVRTLSAHTNRVYTLLFDGVRIISASLDTTICVWDAPTGSLKHTFCGHRSLTSEMAYGRQGTRQILVSSNADETIRVWDVESGECLHVLAGRNKHQSAVTCVQLTKHFIISSGDDGTVKLWDRCTGSHVRDLVRLDGAGRGGVIWRIVASESRLVCAAGSRNGLETTKLIVLNFADSSDGVEAAADKRRPHLCQSKAAPAPPPRLSQILAASTFESESTMNNAAL